MQQEQYDEVYYYGQNDEKESWSQGDNNEFTIDSKRFLHSFNDEPAEIWYLIHYNTTIKHFEQWYNHGYLHRLTGPASIKYEENGEVFKLYYIDGEQMIQERFEIHTNRYKLLNELNDEN